MLESAWLFTGGVAVLMTVLTLLAMSIFSPTQQHGDAVTIVLGVAGFIAWGVWTYGTLDVRVVADATVFQFQMPVLTFFGIMMAIIPGYAAFTGPINVIGRYRDAGPRDI